MSQILCQEILDDKSLIHCAKLSHIGLYAQRYVQFIKL